ncbi:MAG TPA: YidB family protein [Xanthobacteraceae bacterium]
MGLLEDILNTMQTTGASGGAPAQRVPAPPPAPSAQAGQGMSPLAKMLLALLAIYAAKNLRRAPSPSTQPASPAGGRGGTTAADASPAGNPLDDILKGPLGGLLRGAGAGGTGTGGGLGDLLRGPLGGILGGAAAGTVLNGGLNDLLRQLQQSGQGDVVNSWVGTGPNKAIGHRDIADALGSDTLDQLADYSGMQRDDVLSGLSQELPRFVDALTPSGRPLSDEEAAGCCDRERSRLDPMHGAYAIARHLQVVGRPHTPSEARRWYPSSW